MAWFSRKRGDDFEPIRVLRADARIDDPVALKNLLAQLPEADEVSPQLSKQFFARAWEKNAGRDYWIMSDGTNATCLTVCGLTLKQAAAVRVQWDTLPHRSVLTERILAELVSAQTGATVETISHVRVQSEGPRE
jgi:hypothetical protein